MHGHIGQTREQRPCNDSGRYLGGEAAGTADWYGEKLAKADWTKIKEEMANVDWNEMLNMSAAEPGTCSRGRWNR
jgi:hypothetical protein